jgi:hypothetical protein
MMKILRSLFNEQIAPQNRILVWVILLLLTVTLLVFPVHLIDEYHAVQAPYLFDNLPLFGSLFCIWLLLIIFLLFSKRDEGIRHHLENLALICTFGLVFIGFWIMITPYGSWIDGFSNLGLVRWIVEQGNIPSHQLFYYVDYPGMHVLLSVLSMITGLGIFGSVMLFLILNAIFFLAILYIVFNKLLRSGRLATLGIFLVVLAGSAMIVNDMRIFYPRTMGYTLLAGFILLLARKNNRLISSAVPDKLLMLTLFAGMVISYFSTSFLAPLLLLGIFAIQVFSKDTQIGIKPRTIVLLLLMVFAWGMYGTSQTFKALFINLPELEQSILTGDFLTNPLALARANVGSQLPLWASITRTFWWALIIFSAVLGFYNLFKIRKLSFTKKILTGGLIGVTLLTLLGIFGTQGGYQFFRFLMYAPLFCIPILLVFVYRSTVWKRIGLVLLTALIIIGAFPTFLSSVGAVATDAIYPYELSTGEFIESHSSDKGKDYMMYYFSGSYSKPWALYNVPRAAIAGIQLDKMYGKTDDEVWQALDKQAREFRYGVALLQKIFVMSEKDTVFYQHVLGISSDNPEWQKLRDLIDSNSLVYNNNHTQIYVP